MNTEENYENVVKEKRSWQLAVDMKVTKLLAGIRNTFHSVKYNTIRKQILLLATVATSCGIF